MCGIIGCVSHKEDAIEKVIDGLKHLEYRGYDSAGIAFLENNEIIIKKEVGRISNLEKLINDEKSYVSIGHTRWATHGKPTKINAHPHSQGNITLVHNGIIENFMEIKNELLNNGCSFVSDTDTEVAGAYINYLYSQNKNMIRTLSEASKRFLGSYSFGIINSNEPDKIYAIRKDSPLIVGIGSGENFIASDVPSILKYTNKYIDLDNDEIICLSNSEVIVYNNKCKKVNKNILTFDGESNLVEKNGYETYMLKEMHEEADVIKRTCKNEINFDLSKYDSIDIVACGSAYHAGLVGARAIEELVNIKVNVEIASEYQYKKHFYNNKTLVIAISQSGETADTKKCVNLANESGIDTLGIVNVKGSSIARICKNVIYTLAGPEIAVATTKAYLSQVATLILLAIKNSNAIVSKEEINMLPYYIENLVNKNYEDLAVKLYRKEDIYFIGRGVDYAIAMEGSLKLKEISYIHSEAYPAGELKHGTISLINDGTPVVAIATDKALYLKTISNAKEVNARGAYTILVTNKEVENDGVYSELILIPEVNPILEPILAIVPLQMLAYEIAKLRGNDIDKPKNLAKSVTVE